MLDILRVDGHGERQAVQDDRGDRLEDESDMQSGLHVVYPGSPYHLVRHPGLPEQDFLDGETSRAAIELVHLSVWRHGRVQVRGGEVGLSAQAQERREAVRGVQV